MLPLPLGGPSYSPRPSRTLFQEDLQEFVDMDEILNTYNYTHTLWVHSLKDLPWVRQDSRWI